MTLKCTFSRFYIPPPMNDVVAPGFFVLVFSPWQYTDLISDIYTAVPSLYIYLLEKKMFDEWRTCLRINEMIVNQ